MAVIAPFQSLRYSERYINVKFSLRDVITPPYDIITPEAREAYRKRNPYNFVHIDLPKVDSEDGQLSENAPYEHAKILFTRWIREGIFELDPEPSFYYYEIDYFIPTDNILHTRKGFFTLLKLEEFQKGCVYPHEKTFARVKKDRLLLTTFCNAHLSPIFALYSDPEGRVLESLRGIAVSNPMIASYTDDQGIIHRLWRVSDPEVCENMIKAFVQKDIYIADGHHRYETALAYRNLMREKYGTTGGNEPYEYALMYLSPMEDPGLIILPTHRIFPTFPMDVVDTFFEKAREFFEIEFFSASVEGERNLWMDALIREGLKRRNAFGVAFHGRKELALLKAKTEGVRQFLIDVGIREELLDIDVVILDNLIFGHLMNLERAMLEDELKICFSHDTPDALEKVLKGSKAAGFFINPTRIDQVQRVASRCLVMPHKSTYFYPKVVSGLVIYPMDPKFQTGEKL